MFDRFKEAIDYALKTWDLYWEVTKDKKYADEKLYYSLKKTWKSL